MTFNTTKCRCLGHIGLAFCRSSLYEHNLTTQLGYDTLLLSEDGDLQGLQRNTSLIYTIVSSKLLVLTLTITLGDADEF